MTKVFLDSDIILNVLCKEEEPERKKRPRQRLLGTNQRRVRKPAGAEAIDNFISIIPVYSIM